MNKLNENKNEEPIEVEKMFKIKVTNIRTKAFPDILAKTDYYDLSVGDFFIKGEVTGTIYQVVKIERVPISDNQIKRWKSLFDSKTDDGINLLNKYEKSGKFGACKVTYITVLKGNYQNQRNKPKMMSWIELDYPKYIMYNTYNKISLDKLIKDKAANISKFANKISSIITKRNIEQLRLDILQDISNANSPKKEDLLKAESSIEVPFSITENLQPVAN